MHRLPSQARGFTMLELLVATSIMAVVIGGSVRLMTATSNVYRESSIRASASVTADRAVQAIARTLVGSSPGTVSGPVASPNTWSEQVTFDELEGVDPATGAAQWRTCRITFHHAPGETNNGVDDDNNGLVDDGEVELITNYGGPWAATTQLYRNVREYAAGESPNGSDDNENGLIDERGLSFQRVGNSIVVRLTIGVPDGKGNVSIETAQTTVAMRNN